MGRTFSALLEEKVIRHGKRFIIVVQIIENDFGSLSLAYQFLFFVTKFKIISYCKISDLHTIN